LALWPYVLFSVAALTYLLMIPGLRLIGAVALLWIGWKLAFNNEEHNVEAKDTFWGAIGTIVVADAVMGIDNALGIAAAANGKLCSCHCWLANLSANHFVWSWIGQ
jgi:predicted tellurium resistance membrane protein TerC